ncbi:MAG: phosphoenolpyruvate--protein phosphotransferase [Planctomycetes bacterium]|nr:phosphoenolpyruvate--protein phosphotransferase [Planctomycetota bacterium]
MAQHRIVKGISVAPGLALGPAHVVHARPHVVPTWNVPEEDLAREVDRLREAIDQAAEELRRRQKAVAAQVGERDAGIFALHRTILTDPATQRDVEATIRDQRINAEAAVQALIDRVTKRLAGTAAEGMRGWSADFSDPWRAVLDVLMQHDRESIVQGDEQVILAAAELTPQVVTYLARERILAVVTEAGGRFSHGAVLARSFGIPCVVGLSNLLSRLEQGLRVLVDGDAGTVQLRPDQDDVDQFLARLERRKTREKKLGLHASLEPVTTDGHRFAVLVNVESLRDLDTFPLQNCDGVGLLRTEFLYMERQQFPSEEEQYRLYRRVLERLAGRPVTLRTLDIGNDKQLPYFKTPREANPALGWRGLRIAIEWQDLLRVQLRAALRASAHGDLRILLPMVTSIEEVRDVHRIFDEVRRSLVDGGYDVASDVPVGIMVEVPSTLFVLPSLLAEVDYVSVGTNDLVQYLLAVDRDNPLVARLYDVHHPAVLQALARVAEAARAAGKPASVCGEMAGDYATALLLLGLGYDAVSVVPMLLPEVKYAVRETACAEARETAQLALRETTSEGVRSVLAKSRQRLHERQVAEFAAEPHKGEPR